MPLLIFIIIILLYAAFMAHRLARQIVTARTHNAQSKPFNRLISGATKRILVVGDSTMYGAGITDPNNTIGGLFAKRFPEASVETIAVNGAKVRDLKVQLTKAQFEHYDIIMIGIGGNDIVRFSSYIRLGHQLREILVQASGLSNRVILCHCVNVGNIGFFIWPLNYLYDHRSRRLHELYDEVIVGLSQVIYVNFYRPMKSDHYTRATRSEFIAQDAFHPSDHANQYFFRLISDQAKL
jgi:hypothetical protein